MARILVTGGAGYIGSHTCVELLAEGHDVVVVDDYSNSKPEALARVQEIAGRKLAFHEADVCDEAALHRIFEASRIDAVIHFAGLKAVGESVEKPLEYYRVNLGSTVALCRVMAAHGVKRLVFSSSATVYGVPEHMPLRETDRLGATNPYGRTKLMIEEILRDLYAADPSWSIVLLRYFNPIGAHPTGRIGEDPNGIPNNLLPFVSQVAIGRLPELKVYGSDYPTPDGTGVRDYLHVVDLAVGHCRAVDHALATTGAEAVNLGTGTGYSVLDIVRAFEKASGRRIPYTVVERRPGDIAVCYADPVKAKALLGWTAERDLAEMCADAWRWQSQNPAGYGKN
jgi:UDP-glucose 4-epimerase